MTFDTTSGESPVRIPADAGEYADALERILRRIPERAGRYVSCSKGWYPLLAELDRVVTDACPDYELLQVKEKFGELRYYVAFPPRVLDCCSAFLAANPAPTWPDVAAEWSQEPTGLRTREELLAAYRAAMRTREELLAVYRAAEAEHRNLRTVHEGTIEHAEQLVADAPAAEAAQDVLRRVREIVTMFEKQSASTCDECSSTDGAGLHSSGGHYRTVCRECAPKLGYEPLGDPSSTPDEHEHEDADDEDVEDEEE